MRKLESVQQPYSRAIVQLLKSPVDKEDNLSLWDDINLNQIAIQNIIGILGLELIVKKDEGFAFVRQLEDEQGNTLGLIKRQAIGFETSIVLVVLRQVLEDFDNNPTKIQSFEKIISHSEIKEEVALFLSERYDTVKFMKDIDKYIDKARELGYLKVIAAKDDMRYQIHRIIKEKITLDTLQEFNEKLKAYVGTI